MSVLRVISPFFWSSLTALAMLVFGRPVTVLICWAFSRGCRVRQNSTIHSERVSLNDLSIIATSGPT